MEACGDVGGGYVFHDLAVETKFIPGKRFTDISVEIYFYGRTVGQQETPEFFSL